MTHLVSSLRGKLCATILTASILPLAAYAQEPNPTNDGKPQLAGEYNGVPLYRVQVVQRDLDAVNYMHRSGSTKLRFEGTQLLPGAKGEAEVKSEAGKIAVEVHLEGLTPANGFGNEYLTYVLWAISKDGSPSNLGEILPNGKNGKLDLKVTTSLQSFGLIVTAEPYFAVRVPSDLVVAQNIIIQDKANGVLEKVNAHYTLLPRGAYVETSGSKTVIDPITRKEHSPLELYEAHNAYRIAALAGAEKYEPGIMAGVKQNIENADGFDQAKHPDQHQEITFAREAVQRAEDARISTIRKIAAEDRQAQVDARKNAEMARKNAELQAAQSQATAAQEAAARAQADAERARAEAAAAAANKQAQAAQESAQQARERLREQLNSVLATQETARGLIVNMSDVLFDTAKYTLKPDAKIDLAKVSGILLAFSNLKVQVEGHTDSVGGDDYNQKLSENRAGAVRDFLVSQGVPDGNVSAEGFGKTKPVADNATADGRAKNRRVELVVSGAAIGVQTTNGQQ